MIRFLAGKRHGAGSIPGSYSETTSPSLTDPPRELGVRGRVVAVDPASEDGNGASSALERAAVRLAVDPTRHPADDDQAGGRELAGQRARDRPPVRGARSRTHDGNGRLSEQRDVRGTSRVEPRRRIVDRREETRELRIATPNAADLGHAAGRSPGMRYESASATCAGSTTSARASTAIVRATRATRARPLPESGSRSTALDSSSEAASVRRGTAVRKRSRASRTRRRTSADGSAGGAASSAARGRGIATARSKRSRSARESFSRYAVSRCVRARALDGRIAPRAARAHVHRADEHEASREERVTADARDRHHAVLERLPQGLENRTRELGQLVQEQDAAMSQRHLTRPRIRSSTHDRRRRRAVVRRAKRRTGHERAPGRKEARNGVDSRHLQRLGSRERREDSRQAAREHRLAGSRRPHQQDVVRAGGGDLERTAGALLSAHVRQIGLHGLVGVLRQRLDRTGPRSLLGSTRRPQRGCGRARARCPREQPRAPTRPRRRLARGRHAALLRRRRASPAPGESARRGRARRRRRGRRAAPEEAAWSHRARRARSGGRIPILPCAVRPGARLTVIRRLSGQSSAAETTPLRTRCFASWQARSARPTIAKPGIPGWRCASTSTFRGSRPTSAWVTARASTHATVGTGPTERSRPGAASATRACIRGTACSRERAP